MYNSVELRGLYIESYDLINVGITKILLNKCRNQGNNTTQRNPMASYGGAFISQDPQ